MECPGAGSLRFKSRRAKEWRYNYSTEFGLTQLFPIVTALTNALDADPQLCKDGANTASRDVLNMLHAWAARCRQESGSQDTHDEGEPTAAHVV